MLFKAEINNKADVLRWHDARENSCFVLCTGVKMDVKQIFSKWVSDDNVSGREKLETALEFIENNVNNYNVYTIVSFPYEDGIANMKLKDLEGETIRFQFHSSNYSSTSNIGAVSTVSASEGKANDYGRELLLMMQKQNESLMSRLEQMEYKLNQQEDEEEEEDEESEPITGKERLIGALAGIVERPEFTETMFGLIGMIASKFIPQNKVETNE